MGKEEGLSLSRSLGHVALSAREKESSEAETMSRSRRASGETWRRNHPYSIHTPPYSDARVSPCLSECYVFPRLGMLDHVVMIRSGIVRLCGM